MNNKLIQYKTILSDIAKERGLDSLAKHIESFVEVETNDQLTKALGATVYNITKKVEQVQPISYKITSLPEATCDGCQ